MKQHTDISFFVCFNTHMRDIFNSTCHWANCSSIFYFQKSTCVHAYMDVTKIRNTRRCKASFISKSQRCAMWGTTNYSVSSPKFLHRQVQWPGAVCHLAGYACYAYSPDTIKHLLVVCPRQVTHDAQSVNVNKFCSTFPLQKQVSTACCGQNLMPLHCS